MRTVAVPTTHPLRGPMRPAPAKAARGDRNSFSVALKRSPLAYIALIVMSLIVLGAVFAPLMSPYNKDKIDLTEQYLAPSLNHPFGTDDLGRDIFVRVMHGGRITLSVGLLAMLVTLVIGVAVGGVSGYYGGWVDNVLMRVVDLMLAVPVFFVILFVASVVSPKSSIAAVCLMIGFTQWMEVARLVRAVVMTTREHEFVDAARSLGLPDRRIIVRHLLPHTMAPVLVAVTLGLAQAIIIESGLSFLGFGVQPPTPSWGAMLQNAQSYLSDCPWIAVFPGLMIFLTVGCCNILADFLGDALSQIRTTIR
ncbi:MAG TPA: ABC transporter permease [Candidatus Krumholzibacteria bacterium]|nr:ABC transporter permease [Candidatus Krumholzibacteria bacterium]